MKKLAALLSLLALAALALAACGGSSSSTSTTAAQSTSSGGASAAAGASRVQISAAPDNSLAFEQKSVSAKAGEVAIDFNNPAQIAHDVCLEDSSGSQIGCTDQIAESKTTLTENLQPGKYTFYCSVAGHRTAGMEGTLTVK